MMKTKYIYTAITLLVLLTSCIMDDSPKLPRATQTGANTLGCIVNGAVYECSGYYDSSAVLSFGGVYCYFFDDNTVSIGSNCTYPKERVGFNFKFDGKPGTYRNIRNAKKGSDSYVKITKYSSGIISGTFHIIQEYPSGRIVNLTNGRFDIQLQD